MMALFFGIDTSVIAIYISIISIGIAIPALLIPYYSKKKKLPFKAKEEDILY
jgi:hypothetical protein